MPKFYITTTLPYVNAPPHIGFALEMVQADAIARYRRLMGDEVFFNTGTDEHGVKIYQKALEEKKDPQAYADEYAAKFDDLKQALNLSYNNFIRTTDPRHVEAAREFWRRCAENKNEKGEPDIYKAKYRVKYCNGCELEKTDSELEDGKCPLHPNLEIEIREEENYFFRFSRYQKPLLELYEKYPDFVLPAHRLTEIRNFIEGGLTDFSISRLKSKMPWGIPVPGDEEHVMYVWFDALINYVSALGWPDEHGAFEEWWGTKDKPNAIQLAGKDNLRQQSAIWQAMLMSAGLPNSKQILIHGFITSEGEKMSKSLGNVVDPFELVQKYGTDAVRYWLLKEVPTFEDADFTRERFEETYNADLANGLGNLVNRIMALAESYLSEPIAKPEAAAFPEEYASALQACDLKRASEFVWSRIAFLDKRINDTQPFKLLKEDPEEGRTLLVGLITELYWIARMLNPLLPGTNEILKKTILENKKPSALFPRI